MRIPAIIPRRPEPTRPLAENPAAAVEAMFRQVWHTAMHDLPFVNAQIGVEAIGFRRVDGDWLGVVVTPWFISLFLLPGGGTLWQDMPSGEHRQLEFPAGPLEFIGENCTDRSAAIQAYQYCPLITPVQHIADHAAARAAATAVLQAIFEPPPVTAAATEAAPQETAASEEVPARRAFLRGLLPSQR